MKLNADITFLCVSPNIAWRKKTHVEAALRVFSAHHSKEKIYLSDGAIRGDLYYLLREIIIIDNSIVVMERSKNVRQNIIRSLRIMKPAKALFFGSPHTEYKVYKKLPQILGPDLEIVNIVPEQSAYIYSVTKRR